ncbi:MAG: hypothetical protein IBX67_00855 [Dehalococcoidia bacterium]|nr:hypothetical protein [Dehalococcoidia bacterium]
METPVKLIIAAAILLLIGAVLPFLMVLELLEPTFFLSFLSMACSTVGLITGFIGIAQYVAARRQRD